MLQTLPPYKRSRPEIERKLGTKEIRVFFLHVFFAFPSGFVFSVIAPLNVQELDTPGAGGPVCFFQDANRHFAVCQVCVDIHRTMIYILEYFSLLRYFKALPEQ